MKKCIKNGIAFMAAGAITLSAMFPAMEIKAEDNSGGEKVTQFMDCFLPMPIVESLSQDCWGVPDVGPRDQGNGLEDRDLSDYSYWDGGIIKDGESGKYYMFASRWDNGSGHSGWGHSDAIYATSDSFYGPYEDQGKLWPDHADGSGHNVFPFELSEDDPIREDGYKYGIVTSDAYKNSNQVNGAIHVAKSIEGPWESLGIMQGANGDGLYKSNICIIVRPDGRYQTINRDGDIWTADTVKGPWTISSKGLWWNVEGMPTERIEDPVMWYSDGLYHCVANKWDARQAYYLTSEDGLTGWVRHSGTAYTPRETFLTYEDGTVNKWTKLERPNVYIEDGKLQAMTFAVIDVQKEEDKGGDQHGSKIIIVPFDGESLKEFAKTDVFVDPFANRAGIDPIADSTIQSWGSETTRNFGGETFLQLQKNTNQGVFGEGERPNDRYDCKISFLKYDISEYAGKNVDSAVLSLMYQGKPSGSAADNTIEAVLADSDWEEGIGIENVNGNQADPGTLIWGNQPKLHYAPDDLANTVATSEKFATDVSPAEVKIDVTKLVKQFKEENPDENIITFAISEGVGGNRLRIGSKEGGNTRVPKLAITTTPESVPVTGITVTPDKLELVVDEQQQLNAEVAPSNATNKNLTWASADSAIADVDITGKVTAKAAGNTTITAKTEDGSFEASCEVTVKDKAIDEVAVTGITLEPSELTMKTGYVEKLTPEITPADATNKNIIWSSGDNTIAEVDIEGKVTAKTPGTTIITVETEDGGFTAKCSITVEEKDAETVSVTGVTVTPAELTMEEGATEKLTAEVAPFEATNKDVIWSSQDKLIAEVDIEGKVTAKTPGTTIITAETKDGGFIAECSVTVEEKDAEVVSVTGITVTPAELTMEEGTAEKLTAEVVPFEATNKNVIWTSQDKGIAEVDADGNVTAKAPGSTIVTAITEDGNFKAETLVVVTAKEPVIISVTGVTVAPAELTLNAGESGKITASVTPANATNKNISWVSKDNNIAVVDANGNVTAKAAGITIITVKTADGNFTADLRVTVKAKSTIDNSNNNSNNNNTTNGDKTKPVSTNGTKTASVKTGDTTNILFTLILLAGSVAACVGGIIIRKRGNSRR